MDKMLNVLLSIFNEKMLLQLARMLLMKIVQEIDSKMVEIEQQKLIDKHHAEERKEWEKSNY
jgi:hypothetical protein